MLNNGKELQILQKSESQREGVKTQIKYACNTTVLHKVSKGKPLDKKQDQSKTRKRSEKRDGYDKRNCRFVPYHER